MERKSITYPNRWKPGQSGNPKGRPPKGGGLTELLRVEGEELISVGGEAITQKQALAKAVWQFALTGEVWLSGKRLTAESITQWAAVVKWLYSYVEPSSQLAPEAEPELVVRVIRADQKQAEDGG